MVKGSKNPMAKVGQAKQKGNPNQVQNKASLFSNEFPDLDLDQLPSTQLLGNAVYLQERVIKSTK